MTWSQHRERRCLREQDSSWECVHPGQLWQLADHSELIDPEEVEQRDSQIFIIYPVGIATPAPRNSLLPWWFCRSEHDVTQALFLHSELLNTWWFILMELQFSVPVPQVMIFPFCLCLFQDLGISHLYHFGVFPCADMAMGYQSLISSLKLLFNSVRIVPNFDIYGLLFYHYSNLYMLFPNIIIYTSQYFCFHQSVLLFLLQQGSVSWHHIWFFILFVVPYFQAVAGCSCWFKVSLPFASHCSLKFSLESH